MIELAPNRKQGLAIARPVMAAAGATGFGGEAGDLVTLERLGALVTAPISLRPRRGNGPPRIAPLPGGMLLSTGEQNAGWRRVAEQHGGAWARSRVPVIAHILGRTSLGELARRAEGTRGIAALEFDLEALDALPLLAALRRATELPVLVRLPYQGAGLALRAVDAGADALVCISPPRGTAGVGDASAALNDSGVRAARAEDAAAPGGGSGAGLKPANLPVRHAEELTPERGDSGRTQLIAGRVFGPLVLPLALQTLRETLAEVGALAPAVPLIACGGVHTAADVELLLAAGASAVMVDSLAWVAPRALNALLARDYGLSK